MNRRRPATAAALALLCTLLTACASLLLTACRDYEAGATASADADWERAFGQQGEAYLRIALAADEAGATRASYDYVADDATDVVNNATLLVFTATSATPTPSDLTYHSAYRLQTLANASSATSRIARTYTKPIRIDRSQWPGTQRYFAYIVANDNANITLSATTATIANLSTPTLTAGTTFENFRQRTFAELTAEGFLMTNAPLTDATGSSVTYLPQITTSDIYDTEAEAETSPAMTVCIERLAAKLTVHTAAAMTNETGLAFQESGLRWMVDTQNERSYNVRHVSPDYLGYTASEASGKSKTRFIDSEATVTGLHRILWAEDANYSYPSTGPTTQETGLKVELATVFPDKEPGDDPVYCHENTMNEWGMTQDKTTRVVVSVPFSAGLDDGMTPVYDEDFYTLSIDGPDAVYHHATGSSVGAAYLKPVTDKVQPYIRGLIAANADYQAWKALYASTLTEEDIIKFDADVTDDGALATMGFSLNTTNVTTPGAEAAFNALHLQDNVVKPALTIHRYTKGVAYYTVMVRHFFDDDDASVAAEVNKAVTSGSSDYGDVYPATHRAENYLGRFGVVRNTWYDLNLTGIKHLGYTTVPTPGLVPDDEVNDWISLRISISKWSKRSQREKL